MQSAAQKPNSPKQRHGRSRTPPSRFPWAATSGSGRGTQGLFWAKFSITQPLYLGSRGCKNRWFQLGAGSGNQNARRAMGEAGAAPTGTRLAGATAQRCQLGRCCGRGGRGGAWCHCVRAKGDSCRPPPARGWLKPSSLHLILMPGTTPGPHISIL